MKTKWFYPAQDEIKKFLDAYYDYRFVNQVVTQKNVYEKYIIVEKSDENKRIRILFIHIAKTDCKKGYSIFHYEPKED